VISAVNDSFSFSSSFDISTASSSSIESVALIRLGSVTHSTNFDQRYVPLDFTRPTGNSLRVKAPDDSNIAPAGYYMLFILDNDGVPSVAKIVKLID